MTPSERWKKEEKKGTNNMKLRGKGTDTYLSDDSVCSPGFGVNLPDVNVDLGSNPIVAVFIVPPYAESIFISSSLLIYTTRVTLGNRGSHRWWLSVRA